MEISDDLSLTGQEITTCAQFLPHIRAQNGWAIKPQMVGLIATNVVKTLINHPSGHGL